MSKILGEEKQEDIKQIEKQIFERAEIKSFHGNNSLEVKLIKSFEETCVYLSRYLSRNPKELTVLEFYQALEVAIEQDKKQRNGKSYPFK